MDRDDDNQGDITRDGSHDSRASKAATTPRPDSGYEENLINFNSASRRYSEQISSSSVKEPVEGKEVLLNIWKKYLSFQTLLFYN